MKKHYFFIVVALMALLAACSTENDTIVGEFEMNEDVQTSLLENEAQFPFHVIDSDKSVSSGLIFTSLLIRTDLSSAIELYNPTDEPISLENYWLYDSSTLFDLSQPTGDYLVEYNVPTTSTEIPSKSFLVIYTKGLNVGGIQTDDCYWYKKQRGFIKKIANKSNSTFTSFGTYMTYSAGCYLVYRNPVDNKDYIIDAVPGGRAGQNRFMGVNGIRTSGLTAGTAIKRIESDNTPSSEFDNSKWVKTFNPSGTIYPDRRINFGKRWYGR